jgi:hypothetical protein
MDATAILDYFAPLDKWLDEQLKGKPIGGDRGQDGISNRPEIEHRW